MRPKILTWLSVIGLMAAATPAMAQGSWFKGPAPSFNYQNPDGSYDSYTDFSRALWGMPCGIECTRRAAKRWGLVPPHYQDPSNNYYHN